MHLGSELEDKFYRGTLCSFIICKTKAEEGRWEDINATRSLLYILPTVCTSFQHICVSFSLKNFSS